MRLWRGVKISIITERYVLHITHLLKYLGIYLAVIKSKKMYDNVGHKNNRYLTGDDNNNMIIMQKNDDMISVT